MRSGIVYSKVLQRAYDVFNRVPQKTNANVAVFAEVPTEITSSVVMVYHQLCKLPAAPTRRLDRRRRVQFSEYPGLSLALRFALLAPAVEAVLLLLD